jgi:hypothetical protein
MPVTSSLSIIASKTTGMDPLGERLSNRGRMRKFVNNLTGLIGGQNRAPNSVITGLNHATGTILYSSATTNVTSTINGVAIVTDVGASDILTAAAVAAAINASTNALVQYLVRASHLAGTIASATVLEGQHVTICGVRLTARKAATGMQLNEFSCATSDNATATSLAACINAHPVLRDIVFATASTATVTVRARFVAASMPTLDLAKSASTFTLSGAVLAGVAGVCISTIHKGTTGNTITLAAAADGGTATASGARLTGGTNTVVSL